ncbi:MAG: hypothetical protein WC408_03360 [Candidatus Micrarchaeia archaeon]|jgi:hypothetical protein
MPLRGQAVLESLLVFAAYAAVALILVSSCKSAFSSVSSNGLAPVAALSDASMTCVSIGSYSIRSSTSSPSFAFQQGFSSGKIVFGQYLLDCPVKISGGESAVVSDLSEGVPTA